MRWFALQALCVCVIANFSIAEEPAAGDTPLQKELYAGKLADAIKRLEAEVGKAAGHDADQAAFELGFCHFLRAFEKLAQDLHRYGFGAGTAMRNVGGLLPMRALPLPTNPDPEKLTYEAARRLLTDWLDGLTAAEKTLGRVKGDKVMLPLHPALIRIDFNGDGKADEDEVFWKLFEAMSGEPLAYGSVNDLLIHFDRADGEWLRGYCHLLSALTEIPLAYDWKDAFDYGAPLIFPRVDAPRKFTPPAGRDQFAASIMDGVTAIHMLRLKLVDKPRMESALHHLEAVVEQSRMMWKLALAETDDDHEWIPTPKQKSAAAGMTVSEDQLKAWMAMLDEVDLILNGKRLIPFWRAPDGVGVNLRRVFTEPGDFDLILWAQGTGIAPYLEEGSVTSGTLWSRIDDVFGGGFFGFALWVN